MRRGDVAREPYRERGRLTGNVLTTTRARGKERRPEPAFLFLILAQAAHSIEEYATRLYEVFAPARFVSGLVSSDLSVGFVVVNAALVTFGLWCWAFPVRSGWRIAPALVLFWVVLELGNGIGHVSLAISRGGYFPGLVTAPLLLVGAGWLIRSTVAREPFHGAGRSKE